MHDGSAGDPVAGSLDAQQQIAGKEHQRPRAACVLPPTYLTWVTKDNLEDQYRKNPYWKR
jgi:hypothetical protein